MFYEGHVGLIKVQEKNRSLSTDRLVDESDRHTLQPYSSVNTAENTKKKFDKFMDEDDRWYILGVGYMS